MINFLDSSIEECKRINKTFIDIFLGRDKVNTEITEELVYHKIKELNNLKVNLKNIAKEHMESLAEHFGVSETELMDTLIMFSLIVENVNLTRFINKNIIEDCE